MSPNQPMMMMMPGAPAPNMMPIGNMMGHGAGIVGMASAGGVPLQV